jgi:hypothetical protein
MSASLGKEVALPSTPSGATPISIINSVAIRESFVGQYLEGFNTQGTWVDSIQKAFGLEHIQFSALDALYAISGAAGIALLVPLAAATGPVSIPAVALGSTLVGFSAIGMSEPDRVHKIGAGVAAGATIITNPKAVGFVLKEAYGAGKETAKQSLTLLNTTIGPVVVILGATGAAAAANLVNAKKRKRPA